MCKCLGIWMFVLQTFLCFFSQMWWVIYNTSFHSKLLFCVLCFNISFKLIHHSFLCQVFHKHSLKTQEEYDQTTGVTFNTLVVCMQFLWWGKRALLAVYIAECSKEQKSLWVWVMLTSVGSKSEKWAWEWLACSFIHTPMVESSVGHAYGDFPKDQYSLLNRDH